MEAQRRDQAMATSRETRHADEKDRRTRSFGCTGPFKVRKLLGSRYWVRAGRVFGLKEGLVAS